MSSYKIELILAGKNQLASVMNSAAGTVQAGTSKMKSHLDSVGDNGASMGNKIKAGASVGASGLTALGNTGTRVGTLVAHGASAGEKGLEALGIQSSRTGEELVKNANKAQSSLQTVGVHGRNIGTHVAAGSNIAGASLQGMIKHGENAANTLNKVGQSGRNMGSGVAQGSATAQKGLEGVSKSASSASSGVSELGSLLTGVMGGIGAVEIGNALWTGSTQRQFNNAYLSMQLGTEQAGKLSEEIHRIVAAVPGDDTFMNTLLVGAAVRKAEIKDLEHLGYVAADYLAASQMTGQTQIEAQQDLNAYIMTGTTGELQRSRVLQGQVDTLEGKETIHERILALDNALKANHYQGLSTLEVMTIKWEVLKGKIQLAATNLGDKFLPYLEDGVDYLMELDDKTKGLSTQIGVVAAGAVAVGLALGPVVWSAKEVLGSVTGVAEKLTGIGSKKTKVSFDCDAPCPQVTGGTGTTTTTPKTTPTPSPSIFKRAAQYGIEGLVSAEMGAMIWGQGLGHSLSDPAQHPESYGIKENPNAPLAFINDKNVAAALEYANPISYMKKAGINLPDFKMPNFNLGDLWGLGKPQPEGKSFWDKMFGNSGTSYAADGSGKKSITDDIFGKNGALDFSRFGLKMPDIKWPNAGQILNKITDTIKSHIPKFNWEIPTVGQILGGVWDKINPLNWKIPGVNDLLGQTWQKIKELFWNIPNPTDFLNQTWQKIKELWWQIPTAGDILGAIRAMIPSFSWPWGPAGGTRAGSVATNLGNRANTLLSQTRGPRGPLTDMVSGAISGMSGLGQGNIASAMSKQFKGVSAFTDIANGMADHLAYQFYFGDQKSNRQVWDSGTCNCYDGAQFLMTEANRKMGLGGGLTNGLWDGTAIPHTWATIGGQPFDMAAMLLRGQWNPPSGPGNIHQFMTDIGPGLEYLSYGGHAKDPYDAVSNGGNCFDMTLGIMGIASQLFGVPAQMKWGHWDGQSHVWANLAGKDYDLSNMALNRTYSPPPQGPGSSDYGGVHFHKDAIKISGPIYGIDDLDSKIEAGFNKAQEKAIKKQERLTFGG